MLHTYFAKYKFEDGSSAHIIGQTNDESSLQVYHDFLIDDCTLRPFVTGMANRGNIVEIKIEFLCSTVQKLNT